MSSQQVMKVLGNFDMFRVVQDRDTHLTQASKTGAVASVACAVTIATLVLYETGRFFSPDLRSGLAIAKTESDTELVEFNISFPNTHCSRMEFYAFDQNTGHENTKVQESLMMTKRRLLWDTTVDLGPYTSGGGGGGEEGCQVSGHFYMIRIPGNFYFGPRNNGGKGPSSGSHHIHQLRFGDKLKKFRVHRNPHIQQELFGTLENTIQKSHSNHMIYQYFINTIPTYFTHKGHQVDEKSVQYVVHSTTIETTDIPAGIYIRTSPSGQAVEYWYEYQTWSHFLVHICAIVGGVFTVTGFFVPAMEIVKNWRNKYEETVAPASPTQ